VNEELVGLEPRTRDAEPPMSGTLSRPSYDKTITTTPRAEGEQLPIPPAGTCPSAIARERSVDRVKIYLGARSALC
jgi:hypothetical protein